MVQAGDIIAYRERGRLALGVVQRPSSGRAGGGGGSAEVEVLGEDGRRVSLSADKMLLVLDEPLCGGLAQAELKKRLREVHGRVSARAEGFDLRALWELLSQEGGEGFSWEEIAGLLLSPGAPALEKAAVLEALSGGGVYFREKRAGFFAPKEATAVDETLRQEASAMSRAAARARFADWVGERLAGKSGACPPPPADLTGFLDQIKGLALHRDAYPGAEQAAALLAEVRFAGRGRPWDVAFQLLVALGVWREDEELGVIRYGIPTGFSAEALREAEDVEEFVPGAAGCLALTHVPTFTIDDPETREIDDALSLSEEEGGVTVGIHIADASYFIRPGGAVDKGALARGTTVYLARARLAMLPPCLGEDKASLVGGELRPTLSLFAKFDARGNLTAESIRRGFIRVERRLSYDETEALLRAPATDAFADTLCRLGALASSLRERRVAQGAVTIDADEVKVRVGAGGEVTVKVVPGDSPARSLVSEFMILANQIAARYCHAHGLPALYLAQEPVEGAVAPVESFPTARVWVHAVRRLMKRARIGVTPDRHAGLGVPLYTQITSPLRRYHDLQMHYQVKHHLDHGRPLFDEERLLVIAAGAQQSLAEATLCQRESTRYWLLRYLEEKSGETAAGQVVREQGGRYTVELDETRLAVALAPGASLSLGSVVEVRLVHVDARRDLLQAQLA